MQLCCSNYTLESPQISQFTNLNWTKKDEGIPPSTLLEGVSSLRKDGRLTRLTTLHQDSKNWECEMLQNLHSAMHCFLQSFSRKLGWSELPGKKLCIQEVPYPVTLVWFHRWEQDPHSRKSEAPGHTFVRWRSQLVSPPLYCSVNTGTGQNDSSYSKSKHGN